MRQVNNMSDINDFNQIKNVINALDNERPARLGYTQAAIDATGAAEVDALTGVFIDEDSSQINSIPTPDLIATDPLVQAIGLRTQAATVSRMMINHYFGRLGLNLLKLTEKVKLLVTDHLVNRYITPTGKVVESIAVSPQATVVNLLQNQSPLAAAEPTTAQAIVAIPAAVSAGNAGVLTGADKKRLDDLHAEAARLTDISQTFLGPTTFSKKITGSITGNADGKAATAGRADTADKLHVARNIGGVSFDGSADINLPGVNAAGNQNTSGKAATADKLHTPVNIGGVSFDGSAPINLPGVNAAGNQNTSGNAATVTNGVYTEGAQTINGVKTFGSIPVGPASDPTADNQLVRKAYVDSKSFTFNYRTLDYFTLLTKTTIPVPINYSVGAGIHFMRLSTGQVLKVPGSTGPALLFNNDRTISTFTLDTRGGLMFCIEFSNGEILFQGSTFARYSSKEKLFANNPDLGTGTPTETVRSPVYLADNLLVTALTNSTSFLISTNKGATWSVTGPSITTNDVSQLVEVVYQGEKWVYATGSTSKVWRTKDGVNFTTFNIPNNLTDSGLVIAPDAIFYIDNVLVVLAGGSTVNTSNRDFRVYHSIDHGDTWTQVFREVTSTWGMLGVGRMGEIEVTKSGVIVCCFRGRTTSPSRKVYISPDLGQTWILHHDIGAYSARGVFSQSGYYFAFQTTNVATTGHVTLLPIGQPFD